VEEGVDRESGRLLQRRRPDLAALRQACEERGDLPLVVIREGAAGPGIELEFEKVHGIVAPFREGKGYFFSAGALRRAVAEARARRLRAWV
jgi:hypothetical protein